MQEVLPLVNSARTLVESFGVNADLIGALSSFLFFALFSYKMLRVCHRLAFPGDPLVDPIVAVLTDKDSIWTDYCCRVTNGKYRIEFHRFSDGNEGGLKSVSINDEEQPIHVLTAAQKRRIDKAAQDFYRARLAEKEAALRKKFTKAVS